MHRAFALPLTTAAALCSTPALADHPIAGGSVSGAGPIITTAATTLPPGMAAGGAQVSVARPDTYSDAELIALAGQHVHAHTTDYNLEASASLAYGLAEHLTVSAQLPFIRRDDLREGHHSHGGGGVSNTIEELGTVSGIGDLSVTAQWIAAHNHEQGWFVSLLGGLKVPTGSTGKTDPAGNRLETEHQPGTGSWDPLFGLAASKSWGALSLHSSGLYQLASEGAQDTELGDKLHFNGAVVFDLSGGEHADATSGEHEHEAIGAWAVMLETGNEWEGAQRVADVIEDDSGSKVVWLSPGVRFTSPQGWSAGLSAGLPLWQRVRQSHPDNSLRVIAQVGTAF